MIRPTLAVFAIVAIAAMMGAASVAPAYAAEQLMNINEKTTVGPVIFIGGIKEICGVKPVFITSTTTINFKSWNNNKFTSHQITKTTFTDALEDGDTVATISASRSEIGEFDVFPLRFIVEDHNKASCSNGASDASFEKDTKEGSTTFRNELGQITHQSTHHGPKE